jgi:hypothetical protein
MRVSNGGVDKRVVTGRVRTWFLVLAATAVGISGPVMAASSMTGAERLHRLDMMLKLSSARCSQSGSDLRPDYARFVRNHRFALGQARRDLRSDLIQRYGELGADHVYERMNYEMADEYRRNHPWLTCGELKVAARGLAVVQGSATLLEAADQILPESAARHLAVIHRE